MRVGLDSSDGIQTRGQSGIAGVGVDHCGVLLAECMVNGLSRAAQTLCRPRTGLGWLSGVRIGPGASSRGLRGRRLHFCCRAGDAGRILAGI